VGVFQEESVSRGSSTIPDLGKVLTHFIIVLIALRRHRVFSGFGCALRFVLLTQHYDLVVFFGF